YKHRLIVSFFISVLVPLLILVCNCILVFIYYKNYNIFSVFSAFEMESLTSSKVLIFEGGKRKCTSFSLL
ncbi:hypothetical protein KSS87_012711, partial [Heliosperma pusillum]